MLCDKCKEPINKRTSLQNRSLHLYFRLLAEELNEAGYEMQKVLKVDIPWTEKTVKEVLWRPLQEAYQLEKSTTKLSTKDIDKIYDTLNRVIGERTGIHVPFPCIDNLIDYE